MACVIYSDEYGVFLGVAMGMAFWSRLDSAAQEAAPVFESADEARAYLSTWQGDSSLVEFVTVVPDVCSGEGVAYASSAACIAAGLPGWLTDVPAEVYERIYGERPLVH